MKCLEKERGRRYETANGLASEIQRYLTDEPVQAGPPSASYRLRKFVRRNKRSVVAVSVILLTLVAGGAVSTWQAVRATRAAEAERQAKLAEADRAEGERLAKVDAEAAKDQALKRLKQIEKGNEILHSIFTDLDIREVRKGTEPLEAVLAQRLVKAANDLEAEAVALLCCEALNLEGANFCRGYIQNWLCPAIGYDADAIPEKSAQKIFRAADQILRAGRLQPSDEQTETAGQGEP